MKRLISILLIALILLAGCKREKDDVVNQNLVNDGVETSPVVSLPQTENQPEKDPAPEPKPETKPEPKPEVKPEPKPEAKPTPEAEQSAEPEVLRYSGGHRDIFCFTVNLKSTAQLKIPESKLISTLDEYNQYREEYKSFYKSTLYRYYDDKFDEELKNLNIDDRYFGKRDLLIYVFPISSKLTDMYPREFYVDGSIKMRLTEYWYDEAYYGYNYGVVVIGIDKWTLNKIGDVKVEYTDTGKEYMSVYTKTDKSYYLSSVPDNSIDVITNANQFRMYMIQRHGEQSGTFFGFDSAQFDDEYFKKYIIAVNNKATRSHTHVFAVDSDGVLYVANYMDSGTGENFRVTDTDYKTSGTAVFMQIEREKLKNTELSWQVVKGTYPEPDDNNYNGGSVVIKGANRYYDAGYVVVVYGFHNRSDEPIKFEDMFSTAVIQNGVKLKENRAAIKELKSYEDGFQDKVLQGGEGHNIFVSYETTDFSSDFVVEVREKATNRLVTSYKFASNK